MPGPILARLNAEVNAIVNTAEVKQQLVNLGVNPIGRGSLDELEAAHVVYGKQMPAL
jgi:hypothetical protein